jgi:hypothetical protein
MYDASESAFGWNYASKRASYFVYLLLFYSIFPIFIPLTFSFPCVSIHTKPMCTRIQKEPKKENKTQRDIEEKAMDIEDIFRRKKGGT